MASKNEQFYFWSNSSITFLLLTTYKKLKFKNISAIPGCHSQCWPNVNCNWPLIITNWTLHYIPQLNITVYGSICFGQWSIALPFLPTLLTANSLMLTLNETRTWTHGTLTTKFNQHTFWHRAIVGGNQNRPAGLIDSFVCKIVLNTKVNTTNNIQGENVNNITPLFWLVV